MNEIDIFEEAIFKFGVDETMEYFGINPGSMFHDCFYESLKEKERVYLIGNRGEDLKQGKERIDRVHENIHPLIDKTRDWKADQDPVADIKRAVDLIGPPKKFTEKEIEKTKAFLGDDGINFFKELKKEHGTINVVLEKDGFPHAVHFHEGMQIRNFMRVELNYTNDEELDNNWIGLIESCII